MIACCGQSGMWVEWIVRQQAIRAWHRTAMATPGLRAIEMCIMAPRAYDMMDITLSAMAALVLLCILLAPVHVGIKATAASAAWYLFDRDIACIWDMAATPL